MDGNCEDRMNVLYLDGTRHEGRSVITTTKTVYTSANASEAKKVMNRLSDAFKNTEIGIRYMGPGKEYDDLKFSLVAVEIARLEKQGHFIAPKPVPEGASTMTCLAAFAITAAAALF